MADAARSARAAALEEKRRRLEEMRARRNQRSDTASAAVRAKASSNLDEYIDGLLSSKKPEGATPTGAATTAASPAVNQKKEAPANTSTAEEQPNNVGAEAAPPTPEKAQAPAPAAAPIPEKKVETFTISTQTEAGDFPEQEGEEDDTPDDKGTPDEAGGDDDKGEPGDDVDGVTQHVLDPKILSLEEAEEAVTSVPFSSFLNTASKKVERVLGEHVLADLLVNFVGETDLQSEDADHTNKADEESKYVSASQVYECAKWTATRDVTDMDWSPLHREVMLASYHMASSSSHGGILGGAVSAVSPDDTPSSSLAPRSGELQSDGLALVWSLAMPTRPEHIFTCGSPVLCTRFHPTEAPLVIGGCQSGQWVIWDVRAGRLPVQRSQTTKAAHHPIVAMEMIEDNTAMVTAASDGTIQFWSMANLQEPAETLNVGDNVNISSLSVANNGGTAGTLVCGSEHGGLFAIAPPSHGGGASSSSSSSSRASKRVVRALADEGGGHFGMVTAIAARSSSPSTSGHSPKSKQKANKKVSKGFYRGASGLVLSSGVDWNVKLWAPAYHDKPVMTWVNPSYDYLCDVQWSPSHATLYATGSSNGQVGLWNLASSLDEPLGSVDVSGDGGVNKLKFSADGRRLLVASSDKVHVLSLSDEVLRSKADDGTRMMNNLSARGLLSR